MIARFQPYKEFNKTENREITKINFPEYIQSLDYHNITSEALAINCAYITRILEDFLDEEELVPTISEKMGSGNFEFRINKIKIAIPFSLESLTSNSRIDLIPSRSNPLVGSSKISKFGLCRIACATPNLCLILREYFGTLSFILFSRPTNFTTSSIRFLSMFLYKLPINLRLSYPERYIYKSGFSTIAPTFCLCKFSHIKTGFCINSSLLIS